MRKAPEHHGADARLNAAGSESIRKDFCAHHKEWCFTIRLESNIEHLDVTFGGSRLMPSTGSARWVNLTDGMVDAGLLARQEAARPPAQQSHEAIQYQLAKVDFRYGENYTLAQREKLAEWYENIKHRPSFQQSPMT